MAQTPPTRNQRRSHCASRISFAFSAGGIRAGRGDNYDYRERRAVLRGKGLGDKLGGAGKYLQDQLVKNDPTFPRPFPIGNRTGFWEDDVDDWLLKKRDEAI